MVRCFHFAAAIFGEGYVQRFLEAGLPSQLSPGNLPALRQGTHRHHYHIFTPKAEAETIRAAEIFRRLSDWVEVEFHDIGPQVATFQSGKCSAYDIMNFAYATTIPRAFAEAGALIAIWPDVLFSDGTFRRLQELEAHGIRGVGIVGIQAHTSVLQASRDRFLESATGSLVVSPRQLVALALEHLTPYWQQFFADNPRFPSAEATHIQWKVGEGGMLMRSSYYHPILAVPTEATCAFILDGLGNGLDTTDFMATLSSDYDRDIYLVTDSDEFCTVGIDSRTSGFHADPRKINRAEIALALARTAHPHTSFFLRQSMRFHADNLTPQWEDTEREARLLVEDTLALMEFLLTRPEIEADLLALQARGSLTPQNDALYDQVSRRIESLGADWRNSGKRVAIYGAGPWTKRLLADSSLRLCDIAGVVDSNPALQGTSLRHWLVRPPSDLPDIGPEIILICAFRAQEEIATQLRETRGLRAEVHRLFLTLDSQPSL